MYVTIVPVGGCKAGLLGSMREDFDRRMILAIVDSEILCETSCQSLPVMSKDKSKPLSLIVRNSLNFAKIDRTMPGAEKDAKGASIPAPIYKRVFGYYFENIADVKSIEFSYDHEKAKGHPSLNTPSGTLGWNYYITVKVKMNIKGKPTKKVRSLAMDRTGILRV